MHYHVQIYVAACMWYRFNVHMHACTMYLQNLAM